MGQLKVEVFSCRSVPEGEYQCKVVCGKSKAKTKVSKKSATPEWNEKFDLTVDESDSLQIELDQTKKLGHKSYGTVDLPLASLIRGKERIWWEGKGLNNNAELRLSVTAVDFGVVEKKPAAPDQKSILPPMPSADEVNKLYLEMMESLGLGKGFKHPTTYQSKIIDDISVENKWAMVCQQRTVEASQKSGKTIENTPQYWTSKIKAEPSPKLIKELGIVLGGESLAWLKSFIEAGGMSNLLEILGKIEHEIHRRSMSGTSLTKEDAQVQTQKEIVNCLKRLMNNKTGLNGAIETEGGVKKLTLCMDMEEMSRIEIVKLLTIVCLMPPDGHRLVVEGFTSYKALKKEKRRFESLFRFFEHAKTNKNREIYLQLINSLINSPTDIDVRIAIRQEFNNLGVPGVIKTIREKIDLKTEIDLETQLDVYEEEGLEDYKELHERFADLDVNIDDVDDVFKTLKQEMKEAGLATNFLSILQNFIIMPFKTEPGAKAFLLACRIVRQISLNKEKIGSSEEYNINLGDLLTSVESESREVPLQKRIEALESDLNSLNKKLQTLQIELKEKDEKIESLQRTGGGGSGIPLTLGVDTTPTDGGPPPPPPPPPGGEDTTAAPPPPPPPGGAEGGAPPPPPPPGGPGGPPLPPPPGGIKKVVKKKPRKVPESKMKGLQWVKLPPNKVQGTIFESFSFDYKGLKIDYKDLEEQFSAKIIEKKEKPDDKKPQVVQILDPKTNQNLSIFLSQFKNNSHKEICDGIKSLNQRMFTVEQIKQLQAVIPTKDDIIGIQSFLQGGGDPNQLPGAEKFALELDKVPDLEHRLRAFAFKLSFDDKKADIKPGVEVLKAASKEIRDSKRFPELLEFLLEVGNFINEGTPRGGVVGFKLSTLSKLSDTKSTDNTTSLLQYVVAYLEKVAPDLLKFHEDFPSLEAAARVSMATLVGDMNTLSKDFTAVQNSLETTFKEKEKFVEILTKFMEKGKGDLEQMQLNSKLMEDRYVQAVTFFGEDPKTMQPEEFFGIINRFILEMQEAARLNQQASVNAEKNKRREEAKGKRQAELDAKKKAAPSMPDGHDTVVQELFGALKGGDLFKNRRRVQQQAKTQGPPVPVK